jgi:hypothetical protein
LAIVDPNLDPLAAVAFYAARSKSIWMSPAFSGGGASRNASFSRVIFNS